MRLADDVSRREFLGGIAAAVAAAGCAADAAGDPLGLPIGCQTYPVREALGKDFEGTLRELASTGFKRIEMCSPPGYERSGYGPLVGMKATEMRKKIEDAGLRCESCHYQFRELKDSLDDRIAFAHELGLKQMIVSTFSLPKTATLADWARAAGELNKIGERTQKAGIQAGFHNHTFEFSELEGTLIYDKLMSELDPKLAKMQFQVHVISLGFEAAPFFTKYPGRFFSLNLEDC
jgi:sugar phosphate isomerase/epimerase